MTNPTSRAIRYEREAELAEKRSEMLAKTVRVLSALPLLPAHYTSIEEHLLSEELTDEQLTSINKVIITLALGGVASAADVENILTEEQIMEHIEMLIDQPIGDFNDCP